MYTPIAAATMSHTRIAWPFLTIQALIESPISFFVASWTLW
jgi:hypothetical protein